MSSPALDQLSAPASGPRNLTAQLAAWLRRLGFLVTEKGGVAPIALEASWRGPDDLLYQVSYAYPPAGAGIFQVLAYTGRGVQVGSHWGLVHKAEVNRFREARFLLLSNTFYKDARAAALAAGMLQSA